MLWCCAGVIYTTKAFKHAEHGGFADDDTHISMVVSSTKIKKATIKSRVSTKQVRGLQCLLAVCIAASGKMLSGKMQSVGTIRCHN